ncbi:zf-HC2 domain-containing protein [bacterium]|nr:zf-HC2 domain-containing protein [bacterium]
MKCEELSQYVSDYLIGQLGEKRTAQIDDHLVTCASCQGELESLKTVWGKLGSLPEIEPSDSLRLRFDSMLEAYHAGHNTAEKQRWLEGVSQFLDRFWVRQPALQLGFAVAMLVVGLFLGSRFQSPGSGTGLGSNDELTVLRDEVHSLSKLVALSLLQQPSSSERLRGVQYSSMVTRPDQETLRALLNTLNYDQTLNVRLAAVDALAMFYDQDVVRRGLIESLSRQTSPLMQIALINLFVEIEEKESIQTLQFLQGNETFNQTVRRRASWAINQLQ